LAFPIASRIGALTPAVLSLAKFNLVTSERAATGTKSLDLCPWRYREARPRRQAAPAVASTARGLAPSTSAFF
jgi:hypothetical protein